MKLYIKSDRSWRDNYVQDLSSVGYGGHLDYNIGSPGYYAYMIYEDYEDCYVKKAFHNISQSEAIKLWEKALDIYKNDGEKAYLAICLYTAGYDALSTVFSSKEKLNILKNAVVDKGLDISPIFNPSISIKDMRYWINKQLGRISSDGKKVLPKAYSNLPEDYAEVVKETIETIRNIVRDYYDEFDGYIWDTKLEGGKTQVTLGISRSGAINQIIDEDLPDKILDEASQSTGYPRNYLKWRATDAYYPSYGYLKFTVKVPKH